MPTSVKSIRSTARPVFSASACVNRKRCVAEGADYFFDKTMELESLTSTVRQLAEASA